MLKKLSSFAFLMLAAVVCLAQPLTVRRTDKPMPYTLQLHSTHGDPFSLKLVANGSIVLSGVFYQEGHVKTNTLHKTVYRLKAGNKLFIASTKGDEYYYDAYMYMNYDRSLKKVYFLFEAYKEINGELYHTQMTFESF